MINAALALAEWLVEIFPKTRFTTYFITTNPETQDLMWKYPRVEDKYDVVSLIIYGVGEKFFMNVVVPRLKELDIEWFLASRDRAVVTFNAVNPGNFYTIPRGYVMQFKLFWCHTEHWHIRNGDNDEPPQE